MIDLITATLMTFSFTSYMGMLLYWLPLLICSYGYILRTWVNYQDDIKQREKSGREDGVYYFPTDTVGTVLGRTVISIIPVLNLCACVFDVAPGLFSSFFRYISNMFDKPLVPPNKKNI